MGSEACLVRALSVQSGHASRWKVLRNCRDVAHLWRKSRRLPNGV